MPFRSKIQPIQVNALAEDTPAPGMRQVPKYRLKRLFERQFSLKHLSGVDQPLSRSSSEEFEPSSVCLRKMVERYIEDPDSEETQPHPNPCNCFSGSGSDSSDDEDESSSSSRVVQILKSLLLCANVSESDLATKTSEIVDHKCMHETKSNLKKTVAEELVALGYDAAICKSHWDKSKSKSCPCPAGEYEYLDVIVGNDRVLIDFDFQSNFLIARPSKTFTSVSETLPNIYVGQVDRLKKVVNFVSNAAKKSFRKKGLSMPPWRRAEYVLTKWLSPYDRAKQTRGETSGDAGGSAKA